MFLLVTLKMIKKHRKVTSVILFRLEICHLFLTSSGLMELRHWMLLKLHEITSNCRTFMSPDALKSLGRSLEHEARAMDHYQNPRMI